MTIKSSDSFPQSALDRFANQTDFSPAANLKKQQSISSPALTGPVKGLKQPINQNEKADADAISSVSRRLVPLSEENTSPKDSDLNSYQLKKKKAKLTTAIRQRSMKTNSTESRSASIPKTRANRFF